MRQRKGWISISILLAIFVLCSYLLAPNQPKEHPSYVSYSSAPDGTKAIYTYLAEKLSTVSRWEHSPTQLADQKNTLLIMVEPPLLFNAQESQAYQDFLHAGNTIFLLKQNPEGMFDIETTDPIIVDEGVTTLEQVNVEVELASSVRLEASANDQVLLADSHGPIAINRPIGEGNLVMITEPNWLTNEAITSHDHLRALSEVWSSTSYDAILFDDYVHVTSNKISVLSIYPNWILVLGFELVLITMAILWMKGKRFGSVITPREATVRLSDERIQALATWYLKGRNYREALLIQADFLKRRLQEQYGISYKRDWTENTEAIQHVSSNLSLETVRIFTNGLEQVLHRKKVSKQAFLFWSQQIEQIRREVEK